MNYPKQLREKLKKIPRITSMFPLLYRKNEFTGVCKNGTLVAVIKLQGADYTGMSNDKYNLSYNVRKRIFEKEKDFVRLDTISRKVKSNFKTKFAQPDDLVQKMMVKSWQSNFDTVYRTHHYVVISVHDGGLVAKIGKYVSTEYKLNPTVELQKTLDELLLDLTDYSPSILKGDELTSFFATMLNGRETNAGGKIWDKSLANQAIDFDSTKDHCSYGRHRDKIYSGWLSIANYPNKPCQSTLDCVFSLPIEFNLYQSFQCYSKKQAHNAFELRAKELENWGDGNTDLIDELIEVSNAVGASKMSWNAHCFALEVLADSQEQLDTNIRTLKTTLEVDGALFYRETTNIEALFWSRFPTMQSLNLRKRDISSENSAHFATFNSIAEGFDSCGFGDRPVTLFKTNDGGQYSFTFHQTPELKTDILGHTAIIGGTGVGKTTLIAFLLANCLPYKDFKAICFDRLHGLNVFTEIFEGDYLDFATDVKMNPFLMKDNSANRYFLNAWIKRLLKIEDNDKRYDKAIDDVVKMNFQLDRKERNFSELAIRFGIEGSELREMLRPWLPNENLGGFFNADRDSFNFEKQIITFDATLILNQPEVLPVVTDYIFHKIMMQVSEEETPHVLFFDEFPRYVQSPEFFARIMEGLKEIRKKAGVALLAMQDPQAMSSLPNDAGKEVLNALASLIIYPNPSAEKNQYMDFLGLNDKEFDWIKNTPPNSRKVLFKRRETGSSVILDVDLSNLQTKNYDLLKCFNSSVNAVKTMKRYKSESPNNWRLKYLKK